MLPWVLGASLAAGLAPARIARAAEPAPLVEQAELEPPRRHRLSWDAHARFRPVQYVVTIGTPVLFRLFDETTREASQPRWRAPILFDDAARDLLRLEHDDDRRLAMQLSNYGWYGAMAWPLADAAIVALLLDQNPDVAWQLTALALQAYALSGFATLVTIKATARRRPTSHGCSDGSLEPGCSMPPRSFPSGHTSGAFAGAGLVCASHRNLPLYGNVTADRAACIGALALSSATAVLRVQSDRHYASDVIVGAGIGTTVGYLLPTLFQYATNDRQDRQLALLPGRDGGYRLLYAGHF